MIIEDLKEQRKISNFSDNSKVKNQWSRSSRSIKRPVVLVQFESQLESFQPYTNGTGTFFKISAEEMTNTNKIVKVDPHKFKNSIILGAKESEQTINDNDAKKKDSSERVFAKTPTANPHKTNILKPRNSQLFITSKSRGSLTNSQFLHNFNKLNLV